MLFEFEKRRAICTAFLVLPTINYGELLATNNLYATLRLMTTIIDRATDARATMKQTDQYKGRKESLLLYWSHRLHVVCVGTGRRSRYIENHTITYGNIL